MTVDLRWIERFIDEVAPAGGAFGNNTSGLDFSVGIATMADREDARRSGSQHRVVRCRGLMIDRGGR
jgi:hypothetical protein